MGSHLTKTTVSALWPVTHRFTQLILLQVLPKLNPSAVFPLACQISLCQLVSDILTLILSCRYINLFFFIYLNPWTAPEGLRVILRTESSLRVEWEMLDDTTTYKYIVIALEVDTETKNVFNCSTADVNSCLVENLPKDTPFDITIKACATTDPQLCSIESMSLRNRTRPSG